MNFIKFIKFTQHGDEKLNFIKFKSLLLVSFAIKHLGIIVKAGFIPTFCYYAQKSYFVIFLKTSLHGIHRRLRDGLARQKAKDAFCLP